MTNVVFICNKIQCPCKAFDIYHNVCEPKEEYFSKDTYKPTSRHFIYRRSPHQVTNPYSMHVNLVDFRINSFQKSKKMFIDGATQSTPCCALTPRCFSCQKIQTKIINSNIKKEIKHKNMHLLKNPYRMSSVAEQKSKYKFDFIESPCPSSLSLNVRLYKALVPLLKNNSIVQCENKKTDQFRNKKNDQCRNKTLIQFQNKNIIPLSQGHCASQKLFSNKKLSQIPPINLKNENLQKARIQILRARKSNSKHKNLNIWPTLPIENKKVKLADCPIGLHSQKKDPFSKCHDIHYLVKPVENNDNSCLHLSRNKEQCNWCIHAKQISFEVNGSTSPLLYRYDDVSSLKYKNNSCPVPSNLLKDQFDISNENFVQEPSKFLTSNHQKVDIESLSPPLDFSNNSQGIVYINGTSNSTPICSLSFSDANCHSHKTQSYSKDSLCKFCSCHQSIQSCRSLHSNSKLTKLSTSFREPPKNYCTSQIVRYIDILSMKCKEEVDSNFIQYNPINQQDSGNLHQNIELSRKENLDIMFKWTTSNHSQTPISSCNMVASKSPSRSPSPHIEVKIQPKSQCENIFLKQSTSTIMQIQATQCPTPTLIDTITPIGNVGNCHEDNVCNFKTKCSLGEVAPLLQFDKFPTSIHDEESKSCGESSKTKNFFLQTDLLPMHVKNKNCPSLQCIYPSPKCSSCDCHNETKNQVSILPIPIMCQSNLSEKIASSQISSVPTSSCHSSILLSFNSWNSKSNSTCQSEFQSITSCQHKPPPISSCQSTSPPLSSCGTSSRPISSCGIYSPLISTQELNSSLSSHCGSLKRTSVKHIHSPKCAKGQLQDPPCPSQQYQSQYEDFGASNQNYISNKKPTYPPSSPPSLCQPEYSCEPQFPYPLPSVSLHNCCCGKCKCGEDSEMKNPKRCLQCGHFHSCCCGMCLCPNTFCPRSPNYGQYILSPIPLSRQEMAFKHQQKMPMRPIDLNSQKPQKKEFKDHYAKCCVLQDSRSQGRSFPYNSKNYDESKFFQHNSTFESHVLQPLSMYKTKPHHKATVPITQCQSRAQWLPTVWSPLTVSYSCCCQRCLNGKPCTSKRKNN